MGLPLCRLFVRAGTMRCDASVHMEFLSEIGRVESMIPQNNRLPGGETHKGTTACRQSGNKSKGGTLAFCKFSVYGEAGQLSNPTPRVMNATSVIPSLQWRRQNTVYSSMTWQGSLWRTAGNEPERGQTGTYAQSTFHMCKRGIAYGWRHLWRRNPHST